ncbi:MAG: hypothetical protein Q9218_004212 [Villophora microphyllina]
MDGAQAVEQDDHGSIQESSVVTGTPNIHIDNASTQSSLPPAFSAGQSRLLTEGGSNDDTAAQSSVSDLITGQPVVLIGTHAHHECETHPNALDTQGSNAPETADDANLDNNGDTPRTSIQFFTLPLEIRQQIYRSTIPYRLPSLIPVQASSPVRRGWVNLPSTSMGLFGTDRQLHEDCCNFTYGSVQVMKIAITPNATIFFGATLLTAKFLPFPASSNWNWIKVWDLDLCFSKFNSYMRSSWGYAYNHKDKGEAVQRIYNLIDQKSYYEYKHIEEGFIGVLHEMSKVTGLKSLTVRLPCVCCRHKNEGHFIRDRYMVLLRSHLTAVGVKPESLKIILAPIGQKHLPCPQGDCAYYSTAVSRMLMEWPHPRSSLHAEQLGWLQLKQYATLLQVSSELRTALFKTWYVLGWSKRDNQVKQALIRRFTTCIDAELKAAKDGFYTGRLPIRWYLNYLRVEECYIARPSAPAMQDLSPWDQRAMAMLRR